MKTSIGPKTWAIAEGYIPGWSNGPAPEFARHEASCILNATDDEAHVTLTIYHADREPVGPHKMTVAARRTHHFRFNNLTDPELVPLEKSYASVFESDVPIVIQHTRLDSRPAENALHSTIAFPGAEQATSKE